VGRSVRKSREEVLLSRHPEETVRLGQRFARDLGAGDVVALFGELGSGKTTFVQGVCMELVSPEKPSSPTFTLINEYRGRLPVYHFDFYRIDDMAEAQELGLSEYFGGDGVCLIEWAEKITGLLPERRYEVHFMHMFETGEEESRKIRIIRP